VLQKQNRSESLLSQIRLNSCQDVITNNNTIINTSKSVENGNFSI